jgi:excisionase family DNA binding protein
MSENVALAISEKPLLTTKDVADILQVSTTTVLRWVDEGLIPAIKVRYTVRFKEEDIELFIEEHYVGPTPPEKVLYDAK